MQYIEHNHRITIEFDFCTPIWAYGLDHSFDKNFASLELFFFFFNFRISAINLDYEKKVLKEELG